MAQEFIIKSQDIEDKINQLLPSQGGFQAGVDFSASTMVIPIVDLTETAEGSALRQDLQTSFSFTGTTSHNIRNATTTMVNTTGYYRVYGNLTALSQGSTTTCTLSFTDGFSSKILFDGKVANTATADVVPFDFIVKLEAGDSLVGTSSATAAIITAVTRQIADVNGNLTNP